MERLTVKTDEGYIAKCRRLNNGEFAGHKLCVDKLGKLEDLEEQGLLLKLPCKLGTKVYSIDRYFIGKKYVYDGHDRTGDYGHYEYKYGRKIVERKFVLSDIKNLGFNVFLTKEEAEANLKELPNE